MLLKSTLRIFAGAVAMAVISVSEANAISSGRAGLGPITRACTGKTAVCDFSDGGHGAVPSHFIKNVEQKWFTNKVNHFDVNMEETQKTYQQRYFIDASNWKAPNGPIFFYAGNEGDVTGYVNVTGLMWENAQEFGAMVVFAEHRYYGSSWPTPKTDKIPFYLSSTQALADYVELVHHLRVEYIAHKSPVIVFGGSYGGKLAAWARIKYPTVFAGAIAASAPVLAFFGESNAFYDESGNGGDKFWQVVTHTASEQAGSHPLCTRLAHNGFSTILNTSSAPSSPEKDRAVGDALGICPSSLTESRKVDLLDLARWAQNGFDELATGNYPFPSSYLTGSPDVQMPAYPMRVACKRLVAAVQAGATQTDIDALSKEVDKFDAMAKKGDIFLSGKEGKIGDLTQTGNKMDASEDGLLSGVEKAHIVGLREAVAVFYNASGVVPCYPVNHRDKYDGIWDYQYCTEMLPEETYFTSTGNFPEDMFFSSNQPFDMAPIIKHCQGKWNVQPQPYLISNTYGTKDLLKRSGVTNIVFSNGGFDPWSAAGVSESMSESIVTVLIPNGAHHLDLMFSHPDDPVDVRQARLLELKHMRRWVREFHAIDEDTNVVKAEFASVE